jgi:hypothetical protein
MVRYFFNLSGGSTVHDLDGEELPDLNSAKAAAVLIAQDVARNKRRPQTAGVYVCVTDELGKELFRTPLAL